MENLHINVNFASPVGKIKPMHSVNNGPSGSRGAGNAEYFTQAGIPFARTHDANFAPTYGAPHTVDIIAIFPNFDADETDPASYDFHLTDEYMETIMKAGTKVFFRLGNKIEHESKRYGALPPADFAKWARICEYIIRHFNEGWGDGHHYGMEYFEIWNEPDLHPQCWDGKDEDFFTLFEITARHLKGCFPHLKIGGPAITSVNNRGFMIPFFDYITRDKENPVPLDFFSFHLYTTNPDEFANHARIARKVLDDYGYTETEIILNEWNYVRGWRPKEEIIYSHRAKRALKGAAFTSASMIASQKSPMDHLMYYDARVSAGWNGLFDHISQEPLKPYYAIWDFNRLYKLETEVACEVEGDDLYALAATNGEEAAILLTYYKDHKSIDGSGTEEEMRRVRIDWSGFASGDGVEVEYRFLDAGNDNRVVAAETFFGETGAHIFDLPLYTSILVTLKKK